MFDEIRVNYQQTRKKPSVANTGGLMCVLLDEVQNVIQWHDSKPFLTVLAVKDYRHSMTVCISCSLVHGFVNADTFLSLDFDVERDAVQGCCYVWVVNAADEGLDIPMGIYPRIDQLLEHFTLPRVTFSLTVHGISVLLRKDHRRIA